jgi:hypothetical protein
MDLNRMPLIRKKKSLYLLQRLHKLTKPVSSTIGENGLAVAQAPHTITRVLDIRGNRIGDTGLEAINSAGVHRRTQNFTSARRAQLGKNLTR